MSNEIKAYNSSQSAADKAVCTALAKALDEYLPKAESKIWHAHPVWFINENPIAGYSKQKAGIRLMFWSGASFDEEGLKPGTGKFRDASAVYTSIDEINLKDLKRWCTKAKKMQWDYKNIVKRKGKLEKIGTW
ncbi:MAG TPA: DUF1801 domain-containing protein [Flavobacteriales bacterium]|nr:DUF1801 domain-containing protein [Flavobacteriales bacterium]